MKLQSTEGLWSGGLPIESVTEISSYLSEGIQYPKVFIHRSLLGENPFGTLWLLDQLLEEGGHLTVQLESDRENLSAPDLSISALKAMTQDVGWEVLPYPTLLGEKLHALVFLKPALKSPPRYQCRPSEPLDVDENLQLFERAFNESSSPLLWSWKYGQGQSLSMLALRDSRIVAHYGCISRRLHDRGLPTRAVQICDVMVEPSERGVLTRAGAFFCAARASQLAIIGWRDDHAFGFGFPNQRHMILGERLGLYTTVDHMAERRWTPDRGKPSLWKTVRPLLEGPGWDLEIDRLWSAMASDMKDKIIGVRDASYIRDRYLRHPTKSYLLYVLKSRWLSKPLGLMVLRRDEDLCRLVDFVAPLSIIPDLIVMARRLAWEFGSHTLVTWITASQESHFDVLSPLSVPLDIKIPANTLITRVQPDEIKGRWWLMMGDTDFM